MRVYKECHLNYLGYKRKSLRVYILTAVRGTPQALLRDLIYSGPEVLVYLGRKDVEIGDPASLHRVQFSLAA